MAVDAGIPALLAEIAAVGDELGDAESAQRARTEAGAVAAQAARVVVVGEKKRGKSSLINALLRRPGLLPVDADIATSVHVAVYAADQEQATAVCERSADTRSAGLSGAGWQPPGAAAEVVTIPLDKVAEYAALDPDTGDMRHPGVREVRIGLPDPLLRSGIELIDTPGVGGLVSGHAALTMAALTMADALLFVVNGSGELTASECAFLARATERIASVAFVLTQADKYDRWRDVLAANRALIARHAPGFASARWFPVSSRHRETAIAAAAAGRADDAAALEKRSGFWPLEQTLTRDIAARATEVRAGNAAWVAQRVLAKLTADQQRKQQSLAQDPKLIEAVTAQQARLNDARRTDAAWPRDLDREFKELGKQLNRLYQRRVVELQATAERWVADANTATASQVAHDFDAELRALWTDLETSMRQGALSIARRIAAKLGAVGVDALDADVPYPEQLARTRDPWRSEAPPPDGLPEAVSRYWPAMSGFSMVALVVAHLGLAIPPLGLVGAGAALGWMIMKGRGATEANARARADVHRHIQGLLNQARIELLTALQDGMEAMQNEIGDGIRKRMAARDCELSAAKAEALRHLEESGQVLKPQREATEQALRRLGGLSARTAELTAAAAPGTTS